MEWLFEQFLKALLALSLSGITWIVALIAGLTWPFWVILVVWLLIVFFGLWLFDADI